MIYDKIKELCKQKGISINRLENECEFGNGTIRKWDTCVPAVDKVMKVADYFEVPIDYLVRK